MSGQDACLSIKEAKAQQDRVQHSSSHQGEKKSSTEHEVMSKTEHQGK